MAQSNLGRGMMFGSYKDVTELVYRLRGLTKTGAVLHIGAHPDDEDIGLLAYFACNHCVRSVYWSATRGEGGQNHIGPYKGEALGVFRTWETLEARVLDRSEAIYGPFIDFGYCKNADEAFDKWGKERLITEIVRAIRTVQPQVIISRWRGIAEDFHGHHQAVGKAAIEAYRVAADEKRFPGLNAQGLPLWQPAKFYYSMANSPQKVSIAALNLSGSQNPELENEGALRINTGQFDPIAGCSYQERAWLAYNQNKTQAIGLSPALGDFYYYLQLQESCVPVPEKEFDIFDGLDNTLTGLCDYPADGIQYLRTNLNQVKALVSKALNTCRINDPRQSAEGVLEALEILETVRSDLAGSQFDPTQTKALDFYLARKINDFQEVAAQCLGLVLECLSDTDRITPGQPFHTRTILWNNTGSPIEHAEISLKVPSGWEIQKESGSTEHTLTDHKCVKHKLLTPETEELACPYWLKRPHGPYNYNLKNETFAGLPFGPPLVSADCAVRLGKHEIHLRTAAISRKSFPGGNRELPVSVIPPISLFPKDPHEFLPVKPQPQKLKLNVSVLSNVNVPASGSLRLEAPDSFNIVPAKIDLHIDKYNTSQRAQFSVTIPASASPGTYRLRYAVRIGNREYDVIHKPVRLGMPGLPGAPDENNCVREEFIIKPAKVDLCLFDVKFLQRKKYAYIIGMDENIVKSLKNFELDFHILIDEVMGYVELAEFDAVIVGPNAYLIRDSLRQNAGRFLEYVAKGGTLIVQFQGFGYEGKGFVPYTFRYNRPHDRVTHEDAPVTILDPCHHLFNLPNRIDDADFKDWVKDRGLYFFGEWDKRYTPLLSCNDPGETAQQGGLLMASYGQGTYLYTGYSFFYQIPAGVAGAFRLFANILALPAARILIRAEFIKSIPLFSFMSKDDLQEVAGIIEEQLVADGDYLCHEGEQSNQMYIIVDGKVDIVKETDGQRRIIAVYQKGEIIGEMAVLGNMTRSASMIARGDVLLYVIDGALFKSLMHKHPAMSDKVIKMLVQKLAAQ
jgi:LmbE family N-acetylglucosaminyl deacetylase